MFGNKKDESEVNEEQVEETVDVPVKKQSKKSARQAGSTSGKDLHVWSVQEQATQTQPFIYNSREGKAYGLYEAVVEILNRTEE